MCTLRLTMVPIIIAVVMRAAVDAQNCFGGIETFEKTSMVDFDKHFDPAGTLLQQSDQALTRDCVNLCKQQPQCLSFALDYTRFRCAAYSVNSVGRRDHIISTNTTNLFEKVCYKGVPREEYQKVCGLERLWAFERVKNSFLEGFEDSTLTNVGSKDECAKACLMETSFACRRADY
ncbi:PAN domain containing protein 1-like protein, partial [Leptotrombidium deliense]